MRKGYVCVFIIVLLAFITGCDKSDDFDKSISTAMITSFRLDSKNNPLYLQEDIVCLIQDSGIQGRVPYYSDLSNLVATFDFEGKVVYVNGIEQISGETYNDFTKDVVYKVVAENGTMEQYIVSFMNFTGLPVVKISTNDTPILDKDTWIQGLMSVDGLGLFENYSGQMYIRGRGNSTWGAPKKPYAIKLDKKAVILDMPEHKRWVLLANYYDKTALRNAVAFHLSEKYTNLDYTPRMHFVELFLNEVYLGTYQLGEHIKIDENRVNITDNGYLLEVDSKASPEDITFQSLQNVIFNVKEPEIEYESVKFDYIKQFVTNAENALYGDDFLDDEIGYKKYLDINSFVDWYLVNEITKNVDAAFNSSCYMHMGAERKLKMGPLWDFDIALGNIDYADTRFPTGFHVKNSVWISRLFEDPDFVDLVKNRYKKIRSHERSVMQYINEKTNYLQWSVIENNAKWGTLYQYTWPNYAIWGSYSNEVQYMKNWLHQRLEWLDNAFDEL